VAAILRPVLFDETRRLLISLIAPPVIWKLAHADLPALLKAYREELLTQKQGRRVAKKESSMT
jgi:hypothetical protein